MAILAVSRVALISLPEARHYSPCGVVRSGSFGKM